METWNLLAFVGQTDRSNWRANAGKWPQKSLSSLILRD
jgi:hypothetical protein